MKTRVFVTGIGTISAAGMTNSALVKALEEARQCFAPILDPRLEKLVATHAGLIPQFEAHPEDLEKVRVLDRNVHLALAAFRQALEDAGLKSRLGSRAAVVMGTCSGGMLSIEKYYENYLRGKPTSDPDLLFSRGYHTAAKVLAWAGGIEGPVLTVVTACAAGSGAIAEGSNLIRSGLVDTAIVGGSDAFAASTLVGFDALKATCRGMCAPFSTNIGLNLGEGAAFLVLESQARAEQRGAEILAEILGYGLSNDAYHPTAPDPSLKGQTAAMERAIRDADIRADDIDYVNAHGTGTRSNDPVESRGIAKVLGSLADAIPVSSTKSIIGHCLGAAGALEASAVILAARLGIVPPTAGFKEQRDGCNLPDYVPDRKRKWKGRIAISNSFGFGGNNATVVIDVKPDSRAKTESVGNRRENPVITGIGVVSPLGVGFENLADEKWKSRADQIEGRDPQVYSFDVSLVPAIDVREIDKRLNLKGMDLCSVYATLASRIALAKAGFKVRPADMEQVGMVLAIAQGPSKGEREHLREVIENNFALDRVGAFPYVVPNSVAGHAARTLFLKGYNNVIAQGEGAGLAAIICAGIAVTLGHADTVIAASSDELAETVIKDGINSGRWSGETGIRPAEGAASLVIENRAKAALRNAQVIAELIGYTICADCLDPRESSENALERAVLLALERASLSPKDINHVAGAVSGKDQRQSLLNLAGKEPFTLINRIGFAEASSSLFDLLYVLSLAKPGENILALSQSREGLANALILRKLQK